MYKVSELLGKPLLSLCEAKILGTIANIYFDEKMTKGTSVLIYDDEEESFCLPLIKLVDFDGDAAVIKCSDEVEKGSEGIPNPINGSAFNQVGKLLGIVRDIILDGTKVISFLIDEEIIPSEKLLSAGNILVFNDSGKPIKLRPSAQKASTEKNKKEAVLLPKKPGFAPSYDFLLGKKTQRNILAVDGKVIAREGEKITYSIIDAAKREGKLVILALNAL